MRKIVNKLPKKKLKGYKMPKCLLRDTDIELLHAISQIEKGIGYMSLLEIMAWHPSKIYRTYKKILENNLIEITSDKKIRITQRGKLILKAFLEDIEKTRKRLK